MLSDAPYIIPAESFRALLSARSLQSDVEANLIAETNAALLGLGIFKHGNCSGEVMPLAMPVLIQYTIQCSQLVG